MMMTSGFSLSPPNSTFLYMTCFLTTITGSNPLDPPRFILRWFTRSVEMDIRGHATLASAHILFSNGLVGSADTVEFSTQSGILTAKRVPLSDSETKEGSFMIELSLPMIPTCEYNSNDVSMFSKALNGATIVDVKGTTTASTIPEALNGVAKAASTDKIIVVLSFWESVMELQPRVGDIMKCPGKVMIVTAAAPQGSPFDFCSRLFAPKLGLNEVKKLTCNFIGATLLFLLVVATNKTSKVFTFTSTSFDWCFCSFKTL
ncbi:Phenazine biosynthesis PhzF protein [Arabidopsis suecica]|uniref:Phenazine biosynthesis PhzF protein n=1 Tax=Arabidopsis suecica TaxID=45249 RepID=A0A8T1ZGW4_ARASU|nr:Phenazine biosynthesis PhzF protein [Arabidopsis suecica]